MGRSHVRHESAIQPRAQNPTRKTWPTLELGLPDRADPILGDVVLARLDDFHLTGIHEHDTRTWRIFFSSSRERRAALEALTSEFASEGVTALPIDVDDEDWAVQSQARLSAVQVGRVIVAPPWDLPSSTTAAVAKASPSLDVAAKQRSRADLRLIVIEPSLGFGTGHHASTRLCLLALQELDLRQRTVLDIGTGSGVLAIAAVLLGAARAIAIDHDADALEAARGNAARNRAETEITFMEADFRSASVPPGDIVVANLTGAILIATLDRLLDLAAPMGVMILSGFTSDEPFARPDGPLIVSPRVYLLSQADEEGWRCFVLRRR